MLVAVTAINQEVRELAPVLNRPSVREGIEVKSSSKDASIAWMLKRHGDMLHLFAVNLGNISTDVTFTVEAATANTEVAVLGETRTLLLKSGHLNDSFKPYGVHLYKFEAP